VQNCFSKFKFGNVNLKDVDTNPRRTADIIEKNVFSNNTVSMKSSAWGG
jgi:hypothetical protein